MIRLETVLFQARGRPQARPGARAGRGARTHYARNHVRHHGRPQARPGARAGRQGRRRSLGLAWTALALGVGVLLFGARPAQASVFDEATGRLSVQDAAYAVTFDGATAIPAALEPELLDRDDEPVSLGADRFVLDPDGLEGAGALEMGGEHPTLRLHLSALESAFGGRRVEIRFWQRARGTRVRATLRWSVADATDLEREVLVSYFPFQPSGRITDDGWEEYTSGPVDFALPGGQGPAVLELQDLQRVRGQWQYLSYSISQRVLVDALEIRDLGPAAVPAVSCDRLNQAAACGAEGVCLLGRCVDGALVHGPPLQDDVLRRDYLDRRLFEFRSFEGSRLAQTLLLTLEEALSGVRGEATGPTFWSAFRTGISQLRDGHASGPRWAVNVGEHVTNLGLCIHLGEADLLPGGGPAPLVFERAHDNPVADQLRVGDVLTAIDGMAPYDWARAVGLEAGHAGDPRVFELAVAPRLVASARLSGATMTFTRCPAPPGGGAPVVCDASELETVHLDFAAQAEQTLWAGSLPDWLDHSQHCDYRFRRAVSDDQVRRYSFAGYHDDADGVRTLIINGVPSNYSEAGENWRTTVYEALDPPPDYLILDQRLGNGGAIDTTDFIMGLFLSEAAFDRMEIVPQLDRPLDTAVWDEVQRCSGYDSCGSFMRWQLHEMSGLPAAQRGVAATTRVAVLNGLDVSGNDYTSKLFTYREGATRIFSAGPTYGAFGPIATLPSHLDELSGGSMQYWDTVFVAGPGDPLDRFTTGTGVDPDEIVRQRQSDALQGIDTAMEAARAWLLQQP